jgi:D-glycero-D-manno-heptose 1,7-bisphosphate phosphatase
VKGIEKALQKLQNSGFLLIVISNQGGIAKGLYSHQDVQKTHKVMMDHFFKEHILITAIYYCPHHNDYGKCICRKPDSLLIEKALHVYHIDPGQSYLFGDQERDIIAGQKAGIQSFKIPSNADLNDYLYRIPLSAV